MGGVRPRCLAVFVHGTAFGVPSEGFAAQRELDRAARVVLFDRLGYGSRAAPGNGELGWPVDVTDLISLIEPEGGAHLVAHSNGGVAALVLASRRPELVRSMVLVEPNVPQAALDHPLVAARVAAEREWQARSLELDTREFTLRWMSSLGATREGAEAWIAGWGGTEWAGADVSRRERWVGDAPVDFERLGALGAATVVVLGGAAPHSGPSREPGRAMGEGLARRIGAELVVFEESGHAPHHDQSERFNRMLLDVWNRSEC